MTQVLESLGSRYRKSKRTPEADEVLTPDDAVDVMEELLPAQNRSYELGLKLKLLQSEVESIHSTYSKPRSCLLHILIEFTNQTEPKPTWRVIVVALRSPAVNLPALARKMEAAHLSDDDLPPPLHQTPLRSLVHTKAPNDDVVSKASSDSVEGVEAQIERFHQRFNSLKELTIRALDKCCVAVMTVVYILTSIRTVQEHRVFLKENQKALRQCEDHLELFGSLNFYWNYLTPDLLDHLITELAKKHEPFQTVAKEITSYKKDLQDFRKRTTLALFCEAEPNTPEDDPPPGFRKMVVRFDWPPTRTLEDVEMFRRRYAWSYDLQTCAMMLNSIGTGTFIVTLFVPVSVVELLRRKRALNLFKEFNITQIYVHTSTTICIYQKYFESQMDHFSSNSGSADTGGVERVQKKGENYPFVEQPSKDVLCPMSKSLLLQPHLTSCCGKHLSEEVATKIQGEGGVCPLCKNENWNTMLNKHFQHQVNSLCVFCRHEDRGCGWQGELAVFHDHVLSCPMKFAPLVTDLMKLPLDKETTSGATPDAKMISAPKVTISLPPRLAAILSHPRKLKVKCSMEKNAPSKMSRGSSAIDGNFAYFASRGSTSVYKYEWDTDEWDQLPLCPNRNSGLVVINGELTAVGGWSGSRTNTLVTLRERKWVKEYPPMRVSRSDPATVITPGNYIIVVGGFVGRWCSAVELLNLQRRQWFKLQDLPQPLPYPSAVLHGDQLHVIGEGSHGYRRSLPELTSTNPKVSVLQSRTTTWVALPLLPVEHTTAANLCGQVVIIGGSRGSSAVSSIHQLVDGQWAEVGTMAGGRRSCLVANRSPDEIIIVGGLDWLFSLSTVEKCTITEE